MLDPLPPDDDEEGGAHTTPLPMERPVRPSMVAQLEAAVAGSGAPFRGKGFTLLLTRTPRGKIAPLDSDEPDDRLHEALEAGPSDEADPGGEEELVTEAPVEPAQDDSWWARLLAVASFRARWKLLRDESGD